MGKKCVLYTKKIMVYYRLSIRGLSKENFAYFLNNGFLFYSFFFVYFFLPSLKKSNITTIIMFFLFLFFLLFQNYLTNFGYVSGPSQEAENLMSESVKIESIKRFQMFANLPVTGIFDHRTMEMMEKPRCGNSDKPVLNDWDTGRRKRYILSESKWRRTNLTFR